MLNPHTFTPTWPLWLLSSSNFSLLPPSPTFPYLLPLLLLLLLVQGKWAGSLCRSGWLSAFRQTAARGRKSLFQIPFRLLCPPLVLLSFASLFFFLLFSNPYVTLCALDSGIPPWVRNDSSADKIHPLCARVSSWGIAGVPSDPRRGSRVCENVNRYGKRLSLGFKSPAKIAFLHFCLLFWWVFQQDFTEKYQLDLCWTGNVPSPSQ